MKRCVRCQAEMDDHWLGCVSCGYYHRRVASECRQLDVFLQLLKDRVAVPQRETYMREKCPGLIEEIAQNPVLPPATATEFQQVEEELGIELPSIMKVVYSEIGNGGFGPGYGLYSLDEAIKFYRINAGPDPTEYPGWSWPKGLLDICDWGCAIYSSIDCSRPEATVYRFDFDGYDAADPSTYFSDVSAPVFHEEAETFQLWLEWWIDGTLRC